MKNSRSAWWYLIVGVAAIGLPLIVTTITPGLFGWMSMGQSSKKEMEHDIREVAIQYYVAAKEQRFEDLEKLVTWTPAYYWVRSVPDVQIAGEVNSDSKELATASVDNSTFERFEYQKLTQFFPKMSKNLIIPNHDELNVQVNGDFARVTSVLWYEKGPGIDVDLFLVKSSGGWKIFREAPAAHHMESFPW